MESEIKEALSRSVCGGWDRGFLESILEQVGRGRKLSTKQIETVNKVLARNDESSQVVHDQWADTYALEHADNAKCLAVYYARTGYFRELSRDILAGEVPDYRAYTKMSGNKYAQRVLETHNAAPKYEVGALVVARANFQSSNAYFDREDTTRLPWVTVNDVLNKFKTRGGFILEVTNIVRSAAKGAKTYKILPIGASNPIFVEERHFKLQKRVRR
tara:strand:- start:520 stop:1167 length:648 start_codon:yes stop_codon:yes gene_type:complete